MKVLRSICEAPLLSVDNSHPALFGSFEANRNGLRNHHFGSAMLLREVCEEIGEMVASATPRCSFTLWVYVDRHKSTECEAIVAVGGVMTSRIKLSNGNQPELANLFGKLETTLVARRIVGFGALRC